VGDTEPHARLEEYSKEGADSMKRRTEALKALFGIRVFVGISKDNF
jgi:hypothetical protein